MHTRVLGWFWPVIRFLLISWVIQGILLWKDVHPEQWVSKMLGTATTSLSQPNLLWLIAGVLALPLTFAIQELWNRFVRTTASNSQIAQGVPQEVIDAVKDKKSKRIPLIELRDFVTQQPGWEQIREGLQFLDLIKAFREAAHEERFEVWGRNIRSGLFQSEEILQKIPFDYWKVASLDELRFPDSDENSLLCTHILDVSKRGQVNSYSDLEVEREPALEWAKHDAVRYRGEEDKGSVAGKLKKQNPPVVRDTKMHEALAFIESGQWGQKYYEFIATPNSKTKGKSPMMVRQAALDGEIRVWGKLSNSGPHSLIPADYWKIWHIEWFSALSVRQK